MAAEAMKGKGQQLMRVGHFPKISKYDGLPFRKAAQLLRALGGWLRRLPPITAGGFSSILMNDDDIKLKE
jgi:hypothetical protein